MKIIKNKFRFLEESNFFIMERNRRTSLLPQREFEEQLFIEKAVVKIKDISSSVIIAYISKYNIRIANYHKEREI
jgi:hypothetical protein